MQDIERTYGKASFIDAGGNTGADIQLERIEIYDSFRGQGKAYDLMDEIDKACKESGIEMIEAYIMPDQGGITHDALMAFMESNGWEKYDYDMVIKYY